MRTDSSEITRALLVLAAVVVGACSPSSLTAAEPAALPPPADRQVGYARDIEPILRSRCYICHGEQTQQNGLRLDRRDAALRGGYSGAVIEPGQSAQSKLIHRVAGVKGEMVMPPAGERLTPAQIGLLRTWIDGGAPWGPEDSPSFERPPVKPKSLHWAFQPLRRPQPPRVQNAAKAKNSLDAFVLARLEKEGIEPSPEAETATLIRRVHLDLIGLPPTPEQVAKFLANDRPDAYERLVDELLDSEHYGEKWAKYWLDLARYADSDGYEVDWVRPHAWRYRDWVIEALNADMPFDQFTVEQVAGDLLHDATIDQKVATGFHRNTLTNREGGTKADQFRFEQIVDRTNTIGTVWLALTIGCAQCHDHKYDPLTQKEYYELFAFFDTSMEVNIDAPLAGEMGPYLQSRSKYLSKRDEFLRQYGIPELMAPWEERLRYTARHPGESAGWDIHYERMLVEVDNGRKILAKTVNDRNFSEQFSFVRFFLANYEEDVAQAENDVTKADSEELKLGEAKEKLARLDSSHPTLSQAQIIVEDPDPPESHIHIRGDYYQPGIEVHPATPAFLHSMPEADTPGRLALARWLVSPENPLTSRVMVNRLWQELFGRGIVFTSEDFGTQGEKPSHPELLDWLATEFVEQGWSMKQMVRLMVLSATYRQSSDVGEELLDRDPDNILLARQVRLRLPAELVRDVTLAASGLLNSAIGGASISPPQPEGLAELGHTAQFHQSSGKDLYRRGLYVHFQRTVPNPFLMNFDAPNTLQSVCRRERSNTPLQALNLLNDPVFFGAAQGLAARVLLDGVKAFEERLDYAYQLCLSRTPSRTEAENMRRYYQRQMQMLAADATAAEALFPIEGIGSNQAEAAAWTGIASVLLNLDEFITRE